MSHSVSRLARHNLPITLTRHTRGISRVDRSFAAYDITRSKHRVPFVHSSRPRSTHFDPLIKTMARIAVFAHHDCICSYLILFLGTKPEDQRSPSYGQNRGGTDRPDREDKRMVPPKGGQRLLPVDPRIPQRADRRKGSDVAHSWANRREDQRRQTRRCRLHGPLEKHHSLGKATDFPQWRTGKPQHAGRLGQRVQGAFHTGQ